jgi:hypothetical protein
LSSAVACANTMAADRRNAAAPNEHPLSMRISSSDRGRRGPTVAPEA